MKNENMLQFEQIINGFRVGADVVMNHRDFLNAINVFPIADGDTGTNLYSLMLPIRNFTYDNTKDDKTLALQLSEAALLGSRGNSGNIFVQFINELSSQVVKKEKITIEYFTECVDKAVTSSYNAVSQPQEGTILTVMRAWSNELIETKNDSQPFSDYLFAALKATEKSVEETTKQLKILQKNDVVDAGAQGFYFFVEGFTNNFVNPNSSKLISEFETFVNSNTGIKLSVNENHVNDVLSEYRYCTEVILRKVSTSISELKTFLEQNGDSVVISGNRQLTKIHIHTHNPAEIIKYLQEYGEIGEQKVDDMYMQNATKYHKKHKIALVTDSVADLPQDMMFEQQIHVIPMNLLVDGQSFLDKVTIHANQIYTIPDEYKISSAQPNQKVVENMLNFLTDYYDEILILTVSKQLSGTYELIKSLSKNVPKNKRVVVIDTKRNSAAQGLIVQQIAKYIEQQKSFDDIIEIIPRVISHTNIYVSVQDLNPMIKSGRLPGFVSVFIKTLKLKPLVSLDQDGNGSIVNVSIGLRSSEKSLLRKIKKLHQRQRIKQYSLVHGNDLERLQRFSVEIEKIIGKKPEYIMDISAVIAMSAGSGCIAVAVAQFEEGSDSNV